MRRKKQPTQTVSSVEPVIDDNASVGPGRPTKYKQEFAKIAESMCKLGATDADLAEAFDVNTSTIWRWQAAHPEFCRALIVGKGSPDDKVERGLYQRAVGYTYDAVKVMQHQGKPLLVPYKEHVPPDPGAAMSWLKNRRGDKWRDVQSHEHGGVGDFSRTSDEELDEIIASEAEVIAPTPRRTNGHAKH